jgi:pimeloyl-ACP methyl ester carboxylesterase
MSGRDDSFALWVADLLDYYQIERSAFIGPSYGGGILLRLAAHFPKKIACSVLVAPAGLKLGSKVVMIHKILLPLIFYKLNPLGGHLQKIADAMSDFSMKEKDKWLIGDIFKYVKLEQEMPKLTEKDELFQYNAPTLVITGEKDIFFPSDMVNETAKQIITQVEIISHSMGHIPNSHSLPRVNQNIIDFLTEHYQELGKSPLIN